MSLRCLFSKNVSFRSLTDRTLLQTKRQQEKETSLKVNEYLLKKGLLYVSNIMTLYLWIHWFWITLIAAIFTLIPSEGLLTTSLHSISTDLPLVRSSTWFARTTQPHDNESITHTTPPITLSQSFEQKNITTPQNVSNSLFNNSNISTKLNATKPQEHKMLSVINQLNATEDSPLWINNTFNAITASENVTSIKREDITSDYKSNDEEAEKTVPDSSEINLSAAGITGITLGCIICVAIICGISFFLYQNHGFNKPQVLNDRCSNPDSSGYIDDASDNSEEMYSLDNDSFLNSLEAMTIQNYWTDTVKHTKL